MANTCPKCGASWNGLEYACGSKDELFTGFVQSEKCLADDKTGDFETMPGMVPGPDKADEAYATALEKVDEMPGMGPVEEEPMEGD